MRYIIQLVGKKKGDVTPRRKVGARLLTVLQAAEYLGTTVSTLYSKVWRREIPFIKLGRSVRFDIVDLDELIEQSKVKPCGVSAPSAQYKE